MQEAFDLKEEFYVRKYLALLVAKLIGNSAIKSN